MKIHWHHHAYALEWRHFDVELVGPYQSADDRWHLIIMWGARDPDWDTLTHMWAFPPIRWDYWD